MQSGTPFQASRRLITALSGLRRTNQNITQAAARSIAASNAHLVMVGMALRATSVQSGTDQPVYYFPSAVRLHRHRAQIHQLAISGQLKHQAKKLGTTQNHTATI